MAIEYTMLMQGSKNYFDKTIDPLFDHYKPLFDELDWVDSSEKMKASDALFIDRKVSNDATGFLASFVLGTVLFATGWSATKLLDHFVKDKLIAKTGEFAKFLQTTFNLQDGKSIEIRHVVWFEDIDLVIAIRLIVKGDEDMKNQDLLLQAHRNSIDWVNRHGKNAPVHSYLIQDGSCNLEPTLYESLHQMDATEGAEEFQKKIKSFHVPTDELLALKSKLN